VTGRFEILEHTADVGLRLAGGSPEEVLEAAAEGLATLQGAWFPGEGEEEPVEVTASDLAGLLVAWLDEVLYLLESRDAVLGGARVEAPEGGRVTGALRLGARGHRDLESVGVKAATLHRVRFEREPNGTWAADVYLDV
jgi:SHS2 domain-containing protein